MITRVSDQSCMVTAHEELKLTNPPESLSRTLLLAPLGLLRSPTLGWSRHLRSCLRWIMQRRVSDQKYVLAMVRLVRFPPGRFIHHHCLQSLRKQRSVLRAVECRHSPAGWQSLPCTPDGHQNPTKASHGLPSGFAAITNGCAVVDHWAVGGSGGSPRSCL